MASALVCRSVEVALVVSFGLLAPSSEAQSPGPRFERTACWVDGDWARDVQRECGWLVVPESRDRPSTHSVRLAVEIFRAKEPTGAPPQVWLHGGPGGAGGIRLYSEGNARRRSFLHRDVVIYDQRGAGFSQPKLCAAYDAARAAGEARRVCIAELEAEGIDRYAYNTAASAADLIDLRRTLGYASWDVVSMSYGARLAQEAMARDGGGIHAVLLASPTPRSFSQQAEQPLSTQRALERVFAACARQPSCRDAFPNVEQDFYAAYDDLTSSPVPVPIMRPDSTSDTVHFDGTRLVSDVRDRLLYRPRAAVARLPFLFHELRSGDRARAARELVGEGPKQSDVPDAALRELVNCSDHATGGAAYRKTVDSVNALVRPPFRRAIEQGCEEWLPRLRDESMPPPVRSDIPTLILNGYFDDRTPRELAVRIAATLSRVYMVEFPDESHDARPSGCHAAIIQQFFEDSSRQPDTSCIATIPPIPFATTWESARGP